MTENANQLKQYRESIDSTQRLGCMVASCDTWSMSLKTHFLPVIPLRILWYWLHPSVYKVAPRVPSSLLEVKQLPLFQTVPPFMSASRTSIEESYPVGPALDSLSHWPGRRHMTIPEPITVAREWASLNNLTNQGSPLSWVWGSISWLRVEGQEKASKEYQDTLGKRREEWMVGGFLFWSPRYWQLALS